MISWYFDLFHGSFSEKKTTAKEEEPFNDLFRGAHFILTIYIYK